MSIYKLNQRSLTALQGVHPDLVKIVNLAITLTDTDFIVTEGIRSLQKQKQLVAAGASQTMRSRHLTGHAVDLAAMVAGKVRWDYPLYTKLSVAMKAASKKLNIPLEWGGDWKSFKDGPHFQLPWKQYP